MIHLVAILYIFTILIHDNFSEEMNDNRLRASSINFDFVDKYILTIGLIGWLHFIAYLLINLLYSVKGLLISITNSNIIYYID